MISDELCETLERIEAYEQKCPEWYGPLAEEIRNVKLHMKLLLLRLDMPPHVAERVQSEDFEWLRSESVKMAASTAPHRFGEVFDDCVQDLWKKKFGG